MAISDNKSNIPKVNVSVDNEIIEFNILPELINGRFYVPAMAILNALKVEYINFDKESGILKTVKGNMFCDMTLGKKEVFTNLDLDNLETAPFLRNEEMMIPIRFVSENFGYDVFGDGTDKTVSIINSDTLFKESMPMH